MPKLIIVLPADMDLEGLPEAIEINASFASTYLASIRAGLQEAQKLQLAREIPADVLPREESSTVVEILVRQNLS